VALGPNDYHLSLEAAGGIMGGDTHQGDVRLADTSDVDAKGSVSR